MSDAELARVSVGLALAVAVPTLVGGIGARWYLRGAAAGAIAVFAIQPVADRFGAWLCVVAAVAVAAAVNTTGWSSLLRYGAALLLGGGAAVWFAHRETGETLRHAWRSPDLAVIVLGWLLVTFVAGELIGWAVTPISRNVSPPRETREELLHAGRIIGWLERTLIYAAILLGHPEAIALIIAVKSLARLDALKEGAIVEYFLIGNLLSIIAAAAVGYATLALTS